MIKLNPRKDTSPSTFTKGIDPMADLHDMSRVRKGKRYDEVGHDD